MGVKGRREEEKGRVDVVNLEVVDAGVETRRRGDEVGLTRSRERVLMAETVVIVWVILVDFDSFVGWLCEKISPSMMVEDAR